MSSYGYGYSDYSYEGYGYYANGGSYRPYPNAAAYLNGPGSSAYLGRAYSNSFAYETLAGGVYTHTTAHTSGGYVVSRSYSYSGDGYKISRSYHYENFQDKSGPAYGYTYGGYYSFYGPPTTYSQNTFSQTQNVVGATTYFNTVGNQIIATTTGYVTDNYTHQTSEAVDGHPVLGAGYAYFSSSVTDPYGYSTYSSHTSTF
jgi:hypothetical protein